MVTGGDTLPRGDGEGGARALRADAQRNRMRVLDAAWRLLASRHPEELSMEDVAHEAAIGKGTLYRHYPTKGHLFEALVCEGAARLTADMQERIPPEADAPTKLRAIVTLVYDAYENYHISLDLLLNARLAGLAGEDPACPHPMAAVIGRVRGILEQGVREGSFRPLDVDYAAGAVFSLSNPIAFGKQRARLGYSRAELEERLMDLLLHALRA